MYRVHLDSGANQGETPGIGESPSNQPISGLVIFSKRQALSRAVVVNSNMSRGKYLAREGPGSRLRASGFDFENIRMRKRSTPIEEKHICDGLLPFIRHEFVF